MGEGVEEDNILDVLSGLVEKSLVVARGGEQGDVRYRMLEPVRQYARDKLEEDGEGRKWLEAALAKDGLASVVLRIKALEALFWLTYDQWDLDRAEAVAQEAMQLGAQAEIDSSLAASLRIMLASPAWVGGRLRAGEGASRRKPRD